MGSLSSGFFTVNCISDSNRANTFSVKHCLKRDLGPPDLMHHIPLVGRLQSVIPNYSSIGKKDECITTNKQNGTGQIDDWIIADELFSKMIGHGEALRVVFRTLVWHR